MSGVPAREARVGSKGGKAERAMVPDATFSSYYGRPVIKPPSWAPLDIAGYLFLGGLAGGSSLLGAGGDLTGRPALRRAGRLTAATAISVSFVALVHDLGRPARFINMLRVAKPTSPMSMGTWILTAYAPVTGLAAAAEFADRFPSPARAVLRLAGRPAGLAAAAIAPVVATYTSVLIANTAVPSWHGGWRELPITFAGSSAAAAAGIGLIAAPVAQAGPARRFAVAGAMADLASMQLGERRLGPLLAEPLQQGRAGLLLRAARALTAAGGLLAAVPARRSRAAAALAGVALIGGSVCTRFGIFEAGVASARDPKYTVVPQRERLEQAAAARH